MVGAGGNAPLVIFLSCFSTAGLQSADRINTSYLKLVAATGLAPAFPCFQDTYLDYFDLTTLWSRTKREENELRAG